MRWTRRGETRAPHPKVSRGGAVEHYRLDVDDVLFTNRDVATRRSSAFAPMCVEAPPRRIGRMEMRLPNDLDGVVMCGASVSNQRGLSDVRSLVASVDLDEGSVPVEAVADGANFECPGP